ncbi:precorrin-2 C20-methyltransferase /cobalt-factor II C20-methyltransferase [Orenia metallireducens]|uniref:Precorrin-2 C20-methyltransferase /cobalt-factor II C20-methyltransferase n=1 Tax=Orenia metallireducens TaxID=1413210 RepID=A0A285GSJ0_9FIRM|nr:precorrin-2 C(20)-methyltransferase [Orenia metallireducens]PRX29846.1 precorrin-2 C20-methyltransferase /cobalt-factor II C20-methyltransferase [Orenia metallireducens]SNY25291.1 precorrin-2 C20-methyltransferase /cobalt-factor II C20-methyltransferase [Orenia metallireducens]
MAGRLYGLGIGPGDPELLTLKAKRILEEVDLICTPQSSKDKRSVALNIVEEVVDCQGRVKYLLFPMTNDRAKLRLAWDRAAEEIIELLESGQDVAFITLGDPLLYSTYIYILERVREKEFEVETVPGITSINACSARLNLPLAEGKEKVMIIPTAYDCDDLAEILTSYENVVLMKVSKNYEEIVRMLEKLDLVENGVFISRCGQDGEFITRDLRSLIGEKIDYLSMIIVKRKYSVSVSKKLFF